VRWSETTPCNCSRDSRNPRPTTREATPCRDNKYIITIECADGKIITLRVDDWQLD
jgi:hypothetical protein